MPKVLIIKDPAEIAEEEWNGLAARHPRHSIFLEKQWFECWRKHLWGGGKTKLVTVRDGTSLVGLANLVHRWLTIKGVPVHRVLGSFGGIETTYQDFLCRPGNMENDIFELMDGIAGLSWSVLKLWNFAGNSPTVDVIGKWCEVRGYKTIEPQGENAPYIMLPATNKEYLGQLKASVRHNLARRKSKLQREKGGEFKVERKPPGESIDSLIDLHQRKWQSQGQPGVFVKPPVRAFFSEMLRTLSARGKLWMYSIETGGKTISMSAKYVFGKTVHSFLGGWDPDYRDYGPGNLIEAYAIEDAIGQGYAEFDFSIGDYPYKYEFGCLPRRNRNLMVFRSEAVMRLHAILERFGRKAKDA